MPCIVSLPPHKSFHPYILPSPSNVLATPLEQSRGDYRNSRELKNAQKKKMDFFPSSVNGIPVAEKQDSTLQAKTSIPFPCPSNSFSTQSTLSHSNEKISSNSSVPSTPIHSGGRVHLSLSSIATNKISKLPRQTLSCSSAPSLLALTKPPSTASRYWAQRTSTTPPIKKQSGDSTVAGSTSQNTRSVISYLRSWRPPVEYYARRRRHPSLAYPSRRPMLPALLEEQIMPGGHLGLVCADLAISPSSFRNTSRCTGSRCFCELNNSQRQSGWPTCANLQNGMRTSSGLGGWDDESDDDELHQLSEDEEEDDDDDYWSDSDVAEAVTPVSSPGSPSGLILQPLFLTKPPGC